MKLFRKAKDGGPNSTVTGYWLIEWKRLFSVVLLRFDNGTRDDFHSHAFNSLNWVLRGNVREEYPGSSVFTTYRPSWRPVKTLRSMLHRVRSIGTTWVFSIRGPWSKTWQEYNESTHEWSTLTHGRQRVDGQA